jgi:hypothetical protein
MLAPDSSLNTVPVDYFETPGVLHETHKDYKEELSKIENEKRIELVRQRQEVMKNEMIKIIMRQTDYNEEQARESLIRNNTIEKCIEEYLGTIKKPDTKPVSTNQAIYKTIREWMN